MGKVKSAIITGLVAAAILILSFFAIISYPVNDVEHYNSFLRNIHLGSDLTGEVYTLLYPEGVISVSDYNVVVLDEDSDKKDEYEDKYQSYGGVYVEKDKLEDGEEFKNSVKEDAKIISARLDEKGYTGYKVSVEDDYVIRIAVSSNLTYAQYAGKDETGKYNAVNSEIYADLQFATRGGELSLRKSSTYQPQDSALKVQEDFADYFKNISYYSMGGNRAVKMELTDDGFDKLNTLLLSEGDNDTYYFYIGEENLNLTLSSGTALEEKNMYFSGSGNEKNMAILLNSVINGNVVQNVFNDSVNGSAEVFMAASAPFGDYAAVYLFVIILLCLIGGVVYSVIRYKKLGLVHLMVTLIYALVIITSLALIGTTLTVAGGFMVILGYALLTFTNFHVFEAVRKETLSGRTLPASIKLGYKKTLSFILDLHVLLVVISAAVALIGVGELAACGLIFFIATLSSYILYWFTRLMWYVVSSLDKDKFKFAGFTREVLDDED